MSTSNGVSLVKWSERGLKCLHCRPVFVFVVFGEDPEIEAQEKERNTLNFMTKKTMKRQTFITVGIVCTKFKILSLSIFYLLWNTKLISAHLSLTFIIETYFNILFSLDMTANVILCWIIKIKIQ